MMKRFGRIFFTLLAVAVGVGVMPSDSRLSAQQSAGLSPQVMAQMGALMAEKASRTPAQRKMDSQLVYAVKMRRGERIAPNVAALRVTFSDVNERGVVLDVRADVSDGLMNQMRALGADVLEVSPIYRSIRIRVGVDQIEAIAGLPDVGYVQPKQELVTSRQAVDPQTIPGGRRHSRRLGIQKRFEPGDVINPSAQRTLEDGQIVTSVGGSSSEGDATHRAALARSTYGVSGAGVRIGVISDGVTHLAASQASGDLGAVTVLAGQAGSGDEGTAMLEIIHDLAPNAELFYATAIGGPAVFAQNIRNLAAAGCTIIVDDVSYSTESPFQDGQLGTSDLNGGIIAQAVKDVAAAGVLYFSSAANSGNKNDNTSGTWEGDFVDGGSQVHNFGGQNFNQFLSTVPGVLGLFWADPLGGSANDYDLYVLNNAGTAIVASSTNTQDGTQDPFEGISQSFAGERAVIVRFSGSARFLHLDTSRNRLQISTAGSTHGHSATTAANSFGVAATPARSPGPYPGAFNGGNVVETFSSDGPRRIFFNSSGGPLTPGNFTSTGGQVLQKPDFTAADNVSVSGAGGFSTPFFGTSAAAPHAAAIAALVRSRNLAQTPTQVRATLFSSAIDIEALGVDRDSGIGIIMADTAVAAATGPPTITSQPANQNVMAGSNASFTVVASGNPPPTLQWQISTNGGATFVNLTNSPPYSGVTTATLTITNVSGSQNGSRYRVVATNSAGTIASSAAVLTVIGAPVITSQPVSGTVAPGQSRTLSVVASGSGLSYQWYVGTTGTTTSPIAGATASSYTTPPLTSTTRYWVRISNSIGISDSATATITVARSHILDLNGDHGGDVFLYNKSTGNRRFELVTATGFAGLFPSAWDPGWQVYPSDLNGDGYSDVFLYDPVRGFWIQALNHAGDGTFTYTLGNWDSSWTVVPADLDGDGLTDMFVYNFATGVWVKCFTNGSGGFKGYAGGNWDPGWTFYTADLNGDARDDFFLYNRTNGVWVETFSQAGFGGFDYPASGQWDPGWQVIPADLNGDGNADLFLINAAGVHVSALSRSSGGFDYVGGPQWSPGWTVSPGDLNGDGRTDLFLYNSATGNWAEVFSDTSLEGLTVAASGRWDPGWSIAVSDFEDDGRADIILSRADGTWFKVKNLSAAQFLFESGNWGTGWTVYARTP